MTIKQKVNLLKKMGFEVEYYKNEKDKELQYTFYTGFESDMMYIDSNFDLKNIYMEGYAHGFKNGRLK